MTLTGAVRAGRVAAEHLQTDTCTVTRSGGHPVLNEATGKYDPPAPVTVYEGPCRVKSWRQNNDRVVQAGDTAVSLWPFVVALPITATGLEVDDIVTVTGSQLDPGIVGLRLRIRDVLYGSQITARRLGCEVNAG